MWIGAQPSAEFSADGITIHDELESKRTYDGCETCVGDDCIDCAGEGDIFDRPLAELPAFELRSLVLDLVVGENGLLSDDGGIGRGAVVGENGLSYGVP